MVYISFFLQKSKSWQIFEMPLYIVFKGSKKFGAFGAEKRPLYPIFCVVTAFWDLFSLKIVKVHVPEGPWRGPGGVQGDVRSPPWQLI